jgi:hypothetical protein
LATVRHKKTDLGLESCDLRIAICLRDLEEVTSRERVSGHGVEIENHRSGRVKAPKGILDGWESPLHLERSHVALIN